MNEKEIKECLIAAGCDDSKADELLSLISNNKCNEAIKKLEQDRECILDNVHNEEQCINCIDYLIHKLKQQ